MKLANCVTGTVGNEPWYSDGHIMFAGSTKQEVTRTGVKMDAVFTQAVKGLTPTRGFRLDEFTFAAPVRRSVVGQQVIDPKYWEMISVPEWKHYVGGKVVCEPYNGERYIVAKCNGKVVCIVAPMRRK